MLVAFALPEFSLHKKSLAAMISFTTLSGGDIIATVSALIQKGRSLCPELIYGRRLCLVRTKRTYLYSLIFRPADDFEYPLARAIYLCLLRR
jgi:hypothetical protein